ncbi:MAG: signal peptidase I [Candidatus Solibacter usitatus]|nr:signal peptidase I [Candidatus Solibacter usitatus]
MNEDVSSAAPAPEVEITPKPRSAFIGTVIWFRDLMLSVVIAIVVILFLYQPVKVEGTSMMPSLSDQERIFINKFLYRFGLGEVMRGDMVVFYYPADPTKSYIKRVIGLPGDTVALEDGVVYVNGSRLDEDYVPDEYRDRQSIPLTRVPADQFFVMGDHRSSSNDSRSWGPVPRAYIYGKAVFVYWPLEKMGILR